MSAPPLPDDYPFPDELELTPENRRRLDEWHRSPSGLRWRAAYLQRELAELHAELGVAPLSPAPSRTLARAPISAVELVRAGEVGMTPREWRAAIRRGELRARKVGREYVVTRMDFDAYLAARRVSPAPRKRNGENNGEDAAGAAVAKALASGRLRAIGRNGGVQ